MYAQSCGWNRMSSPTQVAAVAIWAALSAFVLSLSCNLALAAPVARSTAAAATTAPAAPPAVTQPQARVYLFRGALGPIFSRGMDRLTKRLEEASIRADVYEFTICRLIADQAIRDFRDNGAPIVLIGHSMGGLCALTFAGILKSENISVSLVVTIDPAQASPKVPLNVERFINIFLSDSVLGGGDVVAEPGYQGHYASFDLKQHEEITHINIDKQDSIHEQLVTAIAQLATTPLPAKGEALPLRYIVPPDAPLELWTAARRNPPVRAIPCSGSRHFTMYRSGHLPRSISIQRVHHSHKASAFWFRAVLFHLSRHQWRRARNGSMQQEGVRWAAETESASERDGNTIHRHPHQVQP